jgi:hypothetical protein
MGHQLLVPVMQTTSNRADQLADDIVGLSHAPIAQLRDRWRSVFRTEPPAAFGPDLLRRGIAQRLQEQRYGPLPAAVQRQLNMILKTIKAAPPGRVELPRRIKAGAILVRQWKDASYRVTVLNDGFEFEGQHYESLSEIARRITGTRWNGPRFFGLRAPIEQKHTAAITTEDGHVGQLF